MALLRSAGVSQPESEGVATPFWSLPRSLFPSFLPFFSLPPSPLPSLPFPPCDPYIVEMNRNGSNDWIQNFDEVIHCNLSLICHSFSNHLQCSYQLPLQNLPTKSSVETMIGFYFISGPFSLHQAHTSINYIDINWNVNCLTVQMIGFIFFIKSRKEQMLPRRNHLPMIYKMQLALVNFGKPWNELRFFKLDNDLTTFVISIVPRPFPLFWFEIRFWEIESLPKGIKKNKGKWRKIYTYTCVQMGPN